MNFGNLKTEIGNWLDKSTDGLSDTTKSSIVNLVIRELLQDNDLWFGEVTTAVPTVAEQNYSPLPNNWSHPYSIWYLLDGKKQDVDYVSKEEFDIKYAESTDTGAPKHYTLWGGKFYWGPTPDAVYQMQVNHYSMLGDMVADEDENIVAKEAWPFVLFKSLEYASLFILEDSRLPIFEAKSAGLKQMLVRQHARKTAGRRPTSKDYGYTGKQ